MGFYLTEWANCERMAVSFTKNKATAQPCRVFLGFFYARKYNSDLKTNIDGFRFQI